MAGPNFENTKGRLHLQPACQGTSWNNAVTMLMKSKKACLHPDARHHHRRRRRRRRRRCHRHRHRHHEMWRRGRAFIGFVCDIL